MTEILLSLLVPGVILLALGIDAAAAIGWLWRQWR
jgi:hypothetical protein